MISYKNKANYKQILFFLVSLLILEFLILKDSPFFWDAISKSTRANWIYNNNFSQLIVPTDINSGHPPLWVFFISIFLVNFSKDALDFKTTVAFSQYSCGISTRTIL